MPAFVSFDERSAPIRMMTSISTRSFRESACATFGRPAISKHFQSEEPGGRGAFSLEYHFEVGQGAPAFTRVRDEQDLYLSGKRIDRYHIVPTRERSLARLRQSASRVASELPGAPRTNAANVLK